MNWLKKKLEAIMTTKPDLTITNGEERPYLHRWWLIPRNPFFNIYLHRFLRSDYDDALHDHPWLFNASLLVEGSYREWIPEKELLEIGGTLLQACQYPDYRDLKEGTFKFRWGKAPHRVELNHGPVTTIFFTGPRVREWGFYCRSAWLHWRVFLGISEDYNKTGVTGRAKGCQ
jgi:hypothetical protein